MAPREKVLCVCCNQMLSRKREREHRRALNSAPYASPPGAYPSRQRRVFGPSSELDYWTEDTEAGPSGTHSSDPFLGPDSIDTDSYSHLDADADEDSVPGPVDADDIAIDFEEGLEGLRPSAALLGGDSDDSEDEFYDGTGGHFYGDAERESDPVRDEDSEGENSDDDADIFDWDRFEAPGLSAWDQLGESYEAEAAAIAHKVNAYDMAICRAFSYKVQSHTTDKAFKMLPHAFPQTPPLPKLDALRSRINFLAGFKPEIYDCCTNSCLCYVGPHKDLDRCIYCNEPRRRANGKPRKKFTYIPLIPRLVAFAANREMAEKHKHRAEHKHHEGVTTDVFDGSHYRSLRGKTVEIGSKSCSHRYFSDPRDVALGTSWDGFSPFKRRKKTAWPLILYDYNLPPDLRFLLEYILALGVIPGPNKPKDSDSFLYPLVWELIKLAHGVRAFDILSGQLFSLHAYLILVFGDIPAVSMFMRMKGHNGISPCRMCKIIGLRVPGSKATTHYVPLDRSCHPDVKADPEAVRVCDPEHLPLRTHSEIISQGRAVEAAKTAAEADRLAKKSGVKGVPLLSHLGSISFPRSFPFDFMHLIWENLIKNLILLWTGDFKGLDTGSEEYELTKAIWEAIASRTAAAADSIPSAYGSRIPNIDKDRPNVSAEMWSFWTLYLGPVLLRRRFVHVKYYQHFIQLVRLLTICMQFEITDNEVEEIRVGFIAWVRVYEDIYFQRDVNRLSVCPLTIHALLHIAPGIKFTGPVWCYWAFPTERYCGSIQPGIRSRRFPWASLDRHVLESAQLTQIKVVYNVFEELSLRDPPPEIQGAYKYQHNDYPTCILLPPRSPSRPHPNQITTIAAALSTRTKASMAQVNAALSTAEIEEWGKVRRVDSDAGDTMRACSLGTSAEDSRDATFVRYEMLEDKHARKRKRTPELELKTFYGQLTHIYKVHFPTTCPVLKITKGTTHIFVAIRTCVLEPDDPLLRDLDIHFYSRMGRLDVIDITSVQCLVGRVKDLSGQWAIIDRSGALARAEWQGEEDDAGE